MRHKRSWAVVAVALLIVCLLLGAGGAAYLRYASVLPPYTPAPVTLPSPNAYDDWTAATALLPGSLLSPPEYEKQSHPQLRQALVPLRPALSRFREGLDKEFHNPPSTSFFQAYPELPGYRRLARALAVEGLVAEREGRLEDAVRSYLDCLRFGTRIPRGGTLIHGLVGRNVQLIGLQRLERVIGKLDAQTAAAAAREMAAEERQFVSAAAVLRSERDATTAAYYDLFRRGGSPAAGLGIKQAFPEAWLFDVQFRLTPKRQIIDGYRRHVDAIIASAEQPYGAAPAAAPPIPRDPLNRLILPLFSSVRVQFTQRDAHWRVIELRLAERAYRLEHGKPPLSAAALVPRYLPSVPADPFASHPLVLKPRAGGALIYSRGPDQDDDGGRKNIGGKASVLGDGDVRTMDGIQGL